VYLRGIVGFLGQDVSRPTVIYEDNQGTIENKCSGRSPEGAGRS
jgi:hypothetical protein